MGFEQEISYCVDCQGVWYPAEMEVCGCCGKHRIVIKTDLAKAVEINVLRKESGKYVRIIDGELQAGDPPVSKAVASTTGDTDEPDLLAVKQELSGASREGTDGVDDASQAMGGSDKDPNDLGGTAGMGAASG